MIIARTDSDTRFSIARGSDSSPDTSVCAQPRQTIFFVRASATSSSSVPSSNWTTVPPSLPRNMGSA